MPLYLQIVGEIKAAREALVEVTLRLRSYIFQGIFQKDSQPTPFHAPSPVGSVSNLEAASSNNTGNVTTAASTQTTAAPLPMKVTRLGGGVWICILELVIIIIATCSHNN